MYILVSSEVWDSSLFQSVPLLQAYRSKSKLSIWQPTEHDQCNMRKEPSTYVNFATFSPKLLTVYSGSLVTAVVFNNARDCVHRRIPGARCSLFNVRVLRRHGPQHSKLKSSIDSQIHSISVPTMSHIPYVSLSGDTRPSQQAQM